jgi:hypothetical protein
LDKGERPIDLLAILSVNDKSESCEKLYAADEISLRKIRGKKLENLTIRFNKTGLQQE